MIFGESRHDPGTESGATVRKLPAKKLQPLRFPGTESGATVQKLSLLLHLACLTQCAFPATESGATKICFSIYVNSLLSFPRKRESRSVNYKIE